MKRPCHFTRRISEIAVHDIAAIRRDRDGWVAALARRPAYAESAGALADDESRTETLGGGGGVWNDGLRGGRKGVRLAVFLSPQRPGASEPRNPKFHARSPPRGVRQHQIPTATAGTRRFCVWNRTTAQV